MVIFNNVARGRPIVLTRHQCAKLSNDAGRDVEAEVFAMSRERFESVTLGQLMRELRQRLAAGCPK
jgi:hypothetical protein